MPGRNFIEGLFGVLFSPSRGLFIFSPIFFFALLGIFLKIKHHQFETLDRYVLGIIFFSLVDDWNIPSLVGWVVIWTTLFFRHHSLSYIFLVSGIEIPKVAHGHEEMGF